MQVFSRFQQIKNSATISCVEPSDHTELLERAREPLLLIDQGGVVIWCNAAAKTLLGDITLQNLLNLLEQDDAKQLLQVEHLGTFEVTVRSAAGQQVSQMAAVLDLSGCELDRLQFLVVFYSAPAKSQILREQLEMLESVAHDLKNPVGAIHGYADALIDTRLGEGLSDVQRNIISRIRATALRSIELVRNYQHLSRLQIEPEVISEEPCSLNQLIQAVVAQLWRDHADSPTLILELAEEELLVYFKRLQLERVIANIFGNAIKYTPKGGSILIRSWLDGETPAFLVQNTGNPIPAEQLEGLFDRYTRASNSEGIGGSGLGLYIVKEILHAGNGRVNVSSNSTDGTIFTAWLPPPDIR